VLPAWLDVSVCREGGVRGPPDEGTIYDGWMCRGWKRIDNCLAVTERPD